MPHDPHLADLMRQALKGRAGISEKKMFGGYCWMLHGNMLAGVGVGWYMFRVGKDLYAQALRWPGAGEMQFTGRPMVGIVQVDADAALDTGLGAWLDFASRFVGSLPPR